MIRSLWISKTGLDAQQTSMDVITNNLANVSTNGFKRSRAVFEDLLYSAKLISETENQQAEVALLQAEANVKTRVAAVDSAKVDLDRTTILAPISGMVMVPFAPTA